MSGRDAVGATAELQAHQSKQSVVSRWKQRVDEHEALRLLQVEAMKLPDMGIAISGQSGRYPKADSVNEFEEHLLNKVDMISDQDSSRYPCGLWGLPPRAGRLKEINRFDAQFFGFSSEQANWIDYQLRILYEVVYESILDAGLNPAQLRGTNTGVFVALSFSEFEDEVAYDPKFITNGFFAQFAVKIAQYFDFRGITLTCDTACASGLYALQSAAQALNEGLIERAIVCCGNINLNPVKTLLSFQIKFLSPTGNSRFLDSRVNGYVKGEACVSLLLESKQVARRNYASIMATLTNADGYKVEGIVFPSNLRQQELLEATKKLANISTNQVEYLEAHGTGTPAGDPQEISGISAVYFPSEKQRQYNGETDKKPDERVIGPLLVGSVKSNMGHSESAAGLCGISKVVLMLERGIIYPSLLFKQPNPNIEALVDGRVEPVVEMRPLRSKIVPISNYGFGGANAHTIVRANHRPAISDLQAELEQLQGENRLCEPRLVLMFGRSEKAVESFFDRIQDIGSRATRYCLSDDYLSLVDALSAGKIDRLMDVRGYLLVDRLLAVSGQTSGELARRVRSCVLERPQQRASEDIGRQTHPQECQRPKLSIILPGLGCQRARMAAGLRFFAPFWSTIERLAEKVALVDDKLDLMRLLCEDEDADKEANERQQTTCEMFVSIVAYQVALINIVRDRLGLGAEFDFVCGQSVGELSCAYASGLLDDRQTILLAYYLGTELDANKRLCAGKMVTVDMSNEEALKLIYSPQFAHLTSLRVACINGRQSVSLSGREGEVVELTKWLRDRLTVQVHEIHTNSIGLHNEAIMDDSMRQKLRSAAAKVLFEGSDYDRSLGIWKVSAISGYDGGESASSWQVSAEYFTANLCKQVDFLSCLERMPSKSVVLELAPVCLLGSQLRDIRPQQTYVNLPRWTQVGRQTVDLLSMIGELYLAGLSLDLSKLYANERQVELPVRRQTPSLSSLITWNHEQELFIPRYPKNFRNSTARTTVSVDLMQEPDKYLADHCVEGRVLYPATGYLYLVWKAFSSTKKPSFVTSLGVTEHDLVPIEFRDVNLSRAIVLSDRITRINIQLDERTGKFEVTEGGSVVVEGYVRCPEEKPNGLLFEHIGEQIRSQRLKMALTSEDMYKKFRVCGYDYGESFQNIQAASTDCRQFRVKYDGHFIAFTDSILQSICLSTPQLTPSNGLFLPVRLDYVRFQPKPILAKMRAAGMAFDLAGGSLNTSAKHETMKKLKQREKNALREVPKSNPETQKKDESEKRQRECLFDVYNDPVMGVIVTDGIEIRGARTVFVPHRADTTKNVLLESYQFVADTEQPVEDEQLTLYERRLRPYVLACDSMALELLARLSGTGRRKSGSDYDAYRRAHLNCLADEQQGENGYSIERNGERTLMSVLDLLLARQLETNATVARSSVRELLEVHRVQLARDLIQRSFGARERVMRPLLETILENCAAANKRMHMKMLEVNMDSGLLYTDLEQLLGAAAPRLQLDYALAHPDAGWLEADELLPPTAQIRTLAMPSADLGALVSEHQLSDLDAIVYKDLSCNQLHESQLDATGLASAMEAFNSALKRGGFALVLMRTSLTLAECLLHRLADHSTVVPGKSGKLGQWLTGEMERTNSLLARRLQLVLAGARASKMLLLARKSDPSGCTALLFRTSQEIAVSKVSVNCEASMVRVSHEHIHQWLPQLKAHLCSDQAAVDTTSGADGLESQEDEQSPVWLCAVATRGQPASGLVGMVQALRAEIGSSRLRCFHDYHTFAQREQQPELAEIAQSSNFKLALERNLIWCCVDELGRLGSYRHFTINEHFNYEDCLCAKQKDSDAQASELSTHLPVVPVYANNLIRGDLSSFAWCEAPMKYLSDVEQASVVQVAYSALNFRDTMLATGQLPMNILPVKLALGDCPLGTEFSGVDANGKRWMGMISSRSIASQVVCTPETSLNFEVPDWMSLREAATIPSIYMTALLAIINCGRAQRGESILIHAGSGGVGQAAIRLSAHLGLKIFTTVGSPAKREFLLEEFADHLSDDRIFGSRDCNFEAKIMEATRGRGVDLVLNSLTGDKFQASLRCLADGGRFLEIGKYEMSANTRLELLNFDTNKSFHGIFMEKLFETEQNSWHRFKRQIEDVRTALNAGLRAGFIKPIRHTCFRRDQVEEAFRYMASGRHIGKVLIEMDGRLEEHSVGGLQLPRLRHLPSLQFAPLKSYVITGGLGGMGLEVAKWLVNKGVRHLVLTSRTGVRNSYQASVLNALAGAGGAKILLVRADQADPGASLEGAQSLCALAQQLAPSGQLGGLFHLSMVLKDGMLDNLSAKDFELVCRPKVNACAHLDEATRALAYPLDLFVAFSSGACGRGNAGQSNYAYANSCMERICEQRRRDNLHGLAIQWGMVGDVGVFYENLGDDSSIIGGTVPQRMHSCLLSLERLLTSPFSTCSSLRLKDRSGVPGDSGAAAGKVDAVAAIMHILGTKDISRVSEQTKLRELGLDSLMAVEIRHYFEREFEQTLTIHEIRSLTVAKMRDMSETGRQTAADNADEQTS